MTNIWIPDGLGNQALEVFTDLEYARYKLKVFKKQQESIMFEMSKVKSAISQMNAMVENLRADSIRIVSLKEFHKIQEGVDHARKMEKKCSENMVKYQEEIAGITAEIEKLQVLFDRIKNNGNVLDFKKHAKRKRPKDR